jgi:PAS domain S-box-containing protein
VSPANRVNPGVKTAPAEVDELQRITDRIPVLIAYVDAKERIRRANRACQEFVGCAGDAIAGTTLLEALGADHYAAAKPYIERALQGEPAQFDACARRHDGTLRDMHISYSPDCDPDGMVQGFVAMAQDITEQKRSEALLAGQKRVLELITMGTRLDIVLEFLCRLVESWTTATARASILLADREGKYLRHGAAPNLPEAYNQAVDGITIGPETGTCGRAAYYKREFVTPDIAADPFWRPYAGVALDLGLRACWSTPILDGDGHIAGTFALYYPKPTLPDERDRKVVATISQTAAVAIFHQRAEEELGAERNRARAILESITDAFYALDSDWRFTYLNDAAERMLHREDLLGKNIWEEFRPAVESAFWREYHRARNDDVVVRFEEFYPPLNGWFAVHAYPSVDGLSVYFQNITERKERELTDAFLRQLDETTHSLTHSAEIVQAVARLLGEHMNVNRCAYAQVEDDGDTFNLAGGYNRGVAGIAGRYTFTHFGRECLRVLRTEEPFIVEDVEAEPRIADAVDSYRFTDIRAIVCVPLLKNEKLVGAIAVHQAAARNWTGSEVQLMQQVAGRCWESIERTRVERELRTSEEQFRTLANTIPNLAWMALADGHIFWYNQRWYDYTGAKPEEMEGWGWQRVHDPAVLPHVMERWTRSIASGEPFEMVFPLLGADGEFRSFLTRVEPVRDSQGSVVRWFGTNTDIAAQQQAEDRLRAAVRELQKLNSELEEFAYVASHDMQEPLRMINAYTQMLVRRHVQADNQQAMEFARTIRTGVERMEELIRDLLSYSRAVHAEDQSPGPADLGAALAQAVSMLESRINETGATVIAGELPVVLGDESQLSQVFQNLLSNALKYCRENEPPQIRISARQENRAWLVSVEDNGIGFQPQYAERIFGLFKRLHKQAYPGTGLGLAICKRVVERYGGRIWAESEPGRGSTFFFVLPGPETKSA